MALTANIIRTAVSQDGSTTIFTDSTVYGTPNEDRNEVAVFFTAYKVDEDLVETALTVEPFDPETATTFTITNDIDGYYKIYFSIVQVWLAGTTYNKYDLVWDPTEEAFYEYINDTPTGGHLVTEVPYWQLVTDPNTKIANIGTDEEPGNLIYQIYGTVIDYITAKCYATAVVKQAKEGCGKDDDCGCNSKFGKAVRRLHTLLTVMQISGIRERFIEAERMARTAEKYCDECGCLTE